MDSSLYKSFTLIPPTFCNLKQNHVVMVDEQEVSIMWTGFDRGFASKRDAACCKIVKVPMMCFVHIIFILADLEPSEYGESFPDILVAYDK